MLKHLGLIETLFFILQELAADIKNDPELSEKFVNAVQSEAHNLLISADTNSAIRSAFMEFIELFGHRSVGEVRNRLSTFLLIDMILT